MTEDSSSDSGHSNEHLDDINVRFEQRPTMDADLLDDVTPQKRRPTGGMLRYPSHKSGFVCDSPSASASERSRTPDSPWHSPEWEPPQTNANWYRHEPYLKDSVMSRHTASMSPSSRELTYPGSEDEVAYAAKLPLPRGSFSPTKEDGTPAPTGVSRSRHTSPLTAGHQDQQASAATPTTAKVTSARTDGGADEADAVADDDQNGDGQRNYIRFRFSGEVQQRTEPLERAVKRVESAITWLTASKLRFVTGAFLMPMVLTIFLQALLAPPSMVGRPDLIKVAQFTRSFEPMIYFSENGIRHLEDLQETGTAVWDLSEAVRVANLTSSPIIVSELDQLADSLGKLATELTGFFAAVDGDFDNILLTMDWARRELVQVAALPATAVSSAVSNVHAALTSLQILSPTDPAALPNRIFGALLGLPGRERARMALQHSFLELVSTLETSISDELRHATALFSIYAAIERQFDNLNRVAKREERAQLLASEESGGGVVSGPTEMLLAVLWQRALGSRARQLRKYERNRALLAAVQARTYDNKRLVTEHSQRLMALQQSLESLRRRLVSPLLRVDEKGTGLLGGIGLEDQIRGLEDTTTYLATLRHDQKQKVMQALYGRSSHSRQQQQQQQQKNQQDRREITDK